MIKIEYPPYQPKIKKEQGKEFIFDEFRKRWVLLTPEEWVRQNFLLWLTESLYYPPSLVAVEKQLLLGDIKKRFDIVVYDNKARAFMLVECKEMNVPLSENVLQQALRYNTAVQADWLVITNGSNCVAFKKDAGSFQPAEQIPSFK